MLFTDKVEASAPDFSSRSESVRSGLAAFSRARTVAILAMWRGVLSLWEICKEASTMAS